jgi:hypothetical protein
MKVDFTFISEEIKAFYRREFNFWLFSIIFLGICVLFFVREVKKFNSLSESYRRIESSYLRIQPEIVKLKEALRHLSWEREYQREEISISMEIDLRDLKKAFNSLKSLSDPERDIFFYLKEMKLNSEKGKPPILSIKGQKIVYK